MLMLTMLKRVTALFFILILAGHVWAGVCGCLEMRGHRTGKVSCCKKKKAQPTVRAKNCCDAVCTAPMGERSPRSQGEATVKVPAPVTAAVAKLIVSLDWKPRLARAALPLPETPEPRLSTHSPDIYLQNHAFLI